MKKTILSLLTSAIAVASFPIQAQQLLYEWAFTNATDTATNSSPTFATNAGTGVLSINIVGGTTPPGTLTYFTNANVGPSLLATNALANKNSAVGAYVLNGQSYNGSPSFVAIATNLNLGEQSGGASGGLYQYTVTFWVQFGPLADSGDFPRPVEFGAETNYDVGGKGTVGNVQGVGASVNDDVASGGFNGVQDGTASLSGGNPTVSITNIFPGGITNDGATWYFWAMTYDGTQTTSNFITWLGTLTNSVGAATAQTINSGEILFSSNATVLLADDNVSGGNERAITTGMVADVRFYQGLMSQSNLDLIRQFVPPNLTNAVVAAPTIVTQPASGNTYVGGSRTFSVGVTGNPSIFSYQWKSNNVTITGATNASYTLSNVTLATTGSFICKITNSIGPTNSAAATISVSSPPAGSFASMILSNNPYSFWLVDEPSNTAVAIYDYIRGNDGFIIKPPAGPAAATYGFGPEAPSYLGFTAGNTDIGTVADSTGQIDLTGLGTYSNTGSTILGWVYMTNDGNVGSGLIFNLVSDTAGGFGMVFGAGNELDYQWGPAAPAVFTASGIDIPLNEWTFVALVVGTNLDQLDTNYGATSDTNATLYVGAPTAGFLSSEDSTYVNGDAIVSGSAITPLALGRTTVSASENGGYYDSSTAQFNQVAVFNKELSPQTITNLYFAGVGLSLTGAPDLTHPGNLLLTYPVGVLYSSTNSVTGPYAPVPGAVSPYDAPMATHGSAFYRVGLH